MPVIARFKGIVVKMYCQPREHLLPHVHVEYGNYAASVSIQGKNCLAGELPAWAMQQVAEWIETNKDALLEMWTSQKIHKI